MYKGKFDQKGKQSSTDIEQLLAQRREEAERQAQRKAARAHAPRPITPDDEPTALAAEPIAPPRAKAAPKSAAKPAQQPVQKKAAASSQPVQKKAAAPAPAKKEKRGPRLGSVIFYTLYFMFILVFFVATFIALQWLNGWLIDYQSAQPDVKAQQVFSQLFTNPDWEALYVASGAQDSPYEGKEEFVNYMNAKVDASKLTYLETSAGLSGDKKYVVRMGDEKISTFTLVDKNKGNGDEIARIPDWQLGAVDVFFQREGTYRILKLDSHTALVNGVTLDDNFTIQIATTIAEEYLPVGTTGASMCIQEITGLMAVPTVEIYDESGNLVDITYDEESKTFTEGTQSQSIGVEEKTAALGAAETICKYMITAVTDRATVAKYLDPQGQAYKDLTSISAADLWMQSNNGYEFAGEEVTDYVRYTDKLFSARVSLTLKVTRTDGSVKDYDYAQSLFFNKTDSGKWLCFVRTNKDVSQPVGKVRLTFMQGDTKLLSDFFETDAKQIITPLLSAPSGKVFTGWVREDIGEGGKKTLTLVFQPDASGIVNIPEGTALSPMTLYALFEDEGAVQAAPTIPETSEATEGADAT